MASSPLKSTRTGERRLGQKPRPTEVHVNPLGRAKPPAEPRLFQQAAGRGRARALACFLAALPLAGAAGEKWRVYENCTLVEDHKANDGDSFLVNCGKRSYLFRLYFVDAAETETSFPDRVQEQADYWEVPVSRVTAIGEEGKRFTAAFLKKPFTVYTHWEDARGRSDRNRYYAIVQSGRSLLSTELVRAGLARVYGSEADLPDGTTAREYWKDLRQTEIAARKAKAGAWKERKPDRPPLKPARTAGAP